MDAATALEQAAAVWSSADYSPTALRLDPANGIVAERLAALIPARATVADIGAGHGHTAAALRRRDLTVIAIEPSVRMAAIGRAHAPDARWVTAVGEHTTLPDRCVSGIASSFGTMLCDPVAGPREWSRILAPGAPLVMTAWDQRGFLAEMTDVMMSELAPGAPLPSHMAWGIDARAEAFLEQWFTDISIEHHDLDWSFPSVAAGMQLYIEGSPTHTWALTHAGERSETLVDKLRAHLQSHADTDDAIRATAGYACITARAR